MSGGEIDLHAIDIATLKIFVNEILESGITEARLLNNHARFLIKHTGERSLRVYNAALSVLGKHEDLVSWNKSAIGDDLLAFVNRNPDRYWDAIGRGVAMGFAALRLAREVVNRGAPSVKKQ